MIDPHNLPDKWELPEIQEFALFAPAVAGHNAVHTAHALSKFLARIGLGRRYTMPFSCIRFYNGTDDEFKDAIRESGMGCYNARAETFRQLANAGLDLSYCSVEDLEKIKGIGPKSSRFFVMYTRPNSTNDYAVLDVHILKWMREALLYPAPKQTPSSTRKYKEIEKVFLDAARTYGMTPRELDENIWKNWRSI